MTDTTPETEHPFDRDAPARMQALVEQYADERPHSGTIVIPAAAAAPFIADIHETARQLAYFRQEFSDMAAASAKWRRTYEEQHVRADRLAADKTALTQTIAAIPDATANAAANLAHARAECDRLRATLDAVRAATRQWRAYAAASDERQLAAASALGHLLDALDGDAGDPPSGGPR